MFDTAHWVGYFYVIKFCPIRQFGEMVFKLSNQKSTKGKLKMDVFIVNKNAQANGDHEVHNTSTGCSLMPNIENQVDLGSHNSCHGAVAKAKSEWPQDRINGC
ncbi:MAG: hypothetical protein ACPGF6_03635, partial [Porticoccaceae bacterium]